MTPTAADHRIEGALPVVLVPGLLCDARLWTDVRARLRAPSQVVELAACETLEAMAARILRQAPPRFLLAGFSMGGMAAILAAAEAPERVGGLMILSTHGDVDDPARRQARRAQRDQALVAPFADVIDSAFLPAVSEGQAPDPRARELTRAMAQDQGPEVYRRHLQALIDRPDIGRAARRLTMPTVVMTGAGDTLATPDQASRLAAAMPRGAFRLAPDCGHMIPLARPAAIAHELQRLTAAACPETVQP